MIVFRSAVLVMHVSILSRWGGGGIGGGFDSSHRPIVGAFDLFNGLSSNILLTFSCYFDNPQMLWGGTFEQKTCCRPLFSRKIHTFTSLSYGTPFSIRIFTQKELGTRYYRDFACTTAGELPSTITNFFGRLTI